MDKDSIIRSIAHCNDIQALREIVKAARGRESTLAQRKYQADCAAAWERVRGLPRGAALYCCAARTFIGGPMQRGDAVTVYAVQPRAKRLWVQMSDGKLVYLTPAGVNRYDLRTEPPASRLPELERKIVEAIAGRIKEALP